MAKKAYRIAKETSEGYVKGVRCGVGHSGNHGLVYDVGYYFCSGCSKSYTPESVRAAQLTPTAAEYGSNSLVS